MISLQVISQISQVFILTNLPCQCQASFLLASGVKIVQNYINYKAGLPNCATGSFLNEEGMDVWS